jgi:hypothetical protein
MILWCDLQVGLSSRHPKKKVSIASVINQVNQEFQVSKNTNQIMISDIWVDIPQPLLDYLNNGFSK